LRHVIAGQLSGVKLSRAARTEGRGRSVPRGGVRAL